MLCRCLFKRLISGHDATKWNGKVEAVNKQTQNPKAVTPPLHWLRAFSASARHLSFTDAAQELLITQSAVSKQVRLLEQALGQQLFIRRHRGLTLTEAGRN